MLKSLVTFLARKPFCSMNSSGIRQFLRDLPNVKADKVAWCPGDTTFAESNFETQSINNLPPMQLES
jgi:hypothetical protein